MDKLIEITYFEIVCKVYHGTPVLRLRYGAGDAVAESNLYTPAEVMNILALWKEGRLLGSFGQGTKLISNPLFALYEE